MVVVNSTEREQLLNVIYHLFAAAACQGVVLHEEYGFFRAYFLAKSAINASQHVDFKLARAFFHVARGRVNRRPRRCNANCTGRTNELAQLARDTFGSASLVSDKVGCAAVPRWNSPPLFGVLHGHFPAKKVAQCHFEAVPCGCEIKPVNKFQCWSFCYHARHQSHNAVITMFAAASGTRRFHASPIN